MQLKTYQQKALEQLDHWIEALKEAQLKAVKTVKILKDSGINDIPKQLQNYPDNAWQSLKEKGTIPGIAQDGGIIIPDYINRTTASGEPIPHVCMKIPTGGGKTLLGVTALERLQAGKGFVLWIVPTKAIYHQTLKAFKTREHPYREKLEHLSGGKVKLLEKDDKFTRQDVNNYLCVMMLMLPSANRQRGREFLKIVRDSGSYISFFPEQDDLLANQKLAKQHPDLEKNNRGDCIKQSLINTLKLIRPIVILDEAHKAYGKNDQNNKEFVRSVNHLNPRFVLELSATPKIGISNILVNIGGQELHSEEMIKLPIEIYSLTNSDWKATLIKSKDKLEEIEKQAKHLKQGENRYIRPIALVRVERTSEAQKHAGMIHAENVRDYLIQNLAVPEEQVRIQSSEHKGLEGEDLFSEMNEIRWIITKDALKEGWDCSFAYMLVLLDNTKAETAITQMVGRVMRQPQARTVKQSTLLNKCYIYCYNTEVEKAVEGVKAGLENEGLTGLGQSVISGDNGKDPKPHIIKRRKPYQKLDIFLPKVLHKDGKQWRPIDYDRDILSSLNWAKISAGEPVNLDDQDIITELKVVVGLLGEDETLQSEIDTGDSLTLDYFVRLLMDIIPNPWQAARIVDEFLQKHKENDAKLLNNRIYLAAVFRKRVRKEIDKRSEQVFYDKIRKNEIRFQLVTDKKLNYELGKILEVSVSEDETPLSKKGKTVQRSLFEEVYESEFNKLEKAFALYLEQSEAIYWWHRIAARQEYAIQGWKRHKVYPDFIACRKDDKLLILETKGTHLKGNEDTSYKQKLLRTIEKTYEDALDRGEMRTVGENPATYRILLEDEWREQIGDIISETS